MILLYRQLTYTFWNIKIEVSLDYVCNAMYLCVGCQEYARSIDSAMVTHLQLHSLAHSPSGGVYNVSLW